MRRWIREQFPKIGPLSRVRFLIFVVLCLGHLALAVAYRLPFLSIEQVEHGGPSIVDFIDRSGPWWTILFGLTGIAVAVAVMTRAGLTVAHTLAGSVTAGYATASWIGAFMSAPSRPVIAAVLATVVTLVHVVMSNSYFVSAVRGEQHRGAGRADRRVGVPAHRGGNGDDAALEEGPVERPAAGVGFAAAHNAISGRHAAHRQTGESADCRRAGAAEAAEGAVAALGRG